MPQIESDAFCLPLSLLVITYNEAAHLEQTLQSLAGLAKEIILVDSGSTDETLEIAERFSANIYHHSWEGFRNQKNWALNQASQPWVLSLDGDEEVSPELKESLIAFFREGKDQDYAGASFARKTWFLGRWIKHGDWYPDRQLRLFRRGAGKWINPIHERVLLEGREFYLKGDLHHYSFDSLREYLDKISLFADAFVEKQAGKKDWSLLENLTRPCWRFVRGYFLKGGFLDGFPGFWIAFATAFSVFVRYSRLYEEQQADQ